MPRRPVDRPHRKPGPPPGEPTIRRPILLPVALVAAVDVAKGDLSWQAWGRQAIAHYLAWLAQQGDPHAE